MDSDEFLSATLIVRSVILITVGAIMESVVRGERLEVLYYGR